MGNALLDDIQYHSHNLRQVVDDWYGSDYSNLKTAHFGSHSNPDTGLRTCRISKPRTRQCSLHLKSDCHRHRNSR